MSSKETAKAIETLEALAEVPPADQPRAFSEASAAARGADRELRAAVAGVIAAVATPSEAAGALRALAHDDDVGVRYAGVAAIASVPWRFRFGPLREALEDPDLGVVAVAADGLSYAGDQRSAPVLHRLVAEKRLRFGALEGLYALHDPELVPIANKLFASRFIPFFDKAMAALVLTREGATDARVFLLKRLQKKFSEERNFIVAHLAGADAGEGRAAVERIAQTPSDASCETALLALARLDREWWPAVEQSIARNSEQDPYAAGETLLGLFDIEWQRAAPLATPYLERSDGLGSAARKIRLGAALRKQYENEVQLRCD